MCVGLNLLCILFVTTSAQNSQLVLLINYPITRPEKFDNHGFMIVLHLMFTGDSVDVNTHCLSKRRFVTSNLISLPDTYGPSMENHTRRL